MELDEIMKRNFVVSFCEGGGFLSVKFGVFRPLAEIRRAEFIAQKTERGVGREPMFILGEKLFIFLCAERRSFL